MSEEKRPKKQVKLHRATVKALKESDLKGVAGASDTCAGASTICWTTTSNCKNTTSDCAET